MNRRGSVLFEGMLMVALLAAVFFAAELGVIRLCNARLEQLQFERLPYDGRPPQ